jgi:hypothetical protein
VLLKYAILDGVQDAKIEEKRIVVPLIMLLHKYYKENNMIGVLIFGAWVF